MLKSVAYGLAPISTSNLLFCKLEEVCISLFICKLKKLGYLNNSQPATWSQVHLGFLDSSSPFALHLFQFEPGRMLSQANLELSQFFVPIRTACLSAHTYQYQRVRDSCNSDIGL